MRDEDLIFGVLSPRFAGRLRLPQKKSILPGCRKDALIIYLPKAYLFSKAMLSVHFALLSPGAVRDLRRFRCRRSRAGLYRPGAHVLRNLPV